MIHLVTGGSGSGKSAYAEKLVTEQYKNCSKYYIATMQVYDEEGKARIERHRQMRKGKGFVTLEQPVCIEDALAGIKEKEEKNCVALVECMSNLAANEIFCEEKIRPKEAVERILKGIRVLSEHLQGLVIVTNNVFEDGIEYDAGTKAYMKALGQINASLALMADTVTEVVVGIPVCIKECRAGKEKKEGKLG